MATPDRADGEEADIEIETIGVWEAELEEDVDPHSDPLLEVVRCGRPLGSPRVYIHVRALARIVEHVGGDTQTEVAGVLLGRFYTSRGRLVTDVRDVLRASETRAGISHVTLSHDTWSAIFRDLERDEEQSIVGWYHSHPGIGVFFSRQDMFIQESFFDGDGQVGLVVDPIRHENGAFVHRKGRVEPARGYWISSPKGEGAEARKLAGMLRYQIASANQRGPGPIRRLLARLGGPGRPGHPRAWRR